jgi:hypothetical protein
MALQTLLLANGVDSIYLANSIDFLLVDVAHNALSLSDTETLIVDNAPTYTRTDARGLSDASSIIDSGASLAAGRAKSITGEIAMNNSQGVVLLANGVDILLLANGVDDLLINFSDQVSMKVTAGRQNTDTSNMREASLTVRSNLNRAFSDTATYIKESNLSITHIHTPVTVPLSLSDTATYIHEHATPTLNDAPGKVRVYPSRIRFPRVGGPKLKISVYQTNYHGTFTVTSSDPTKVSVVIDPNDTTHGFLLTSLAADTSGVTITATGG